MYAAISCSDKTIGVYDFASGECEATVYGHSGKILAKNTLTHLLYRRLGRPVHVF